MASTGSCSQRRRTVHPAEFSALLTASSRRWFLASFGSQYETFLRGCVPCSGHECQKQPSIKTATRCRGNTMSTHTLSPPASRCTFFRNRNPDAWSARRSRTSGAESILRLWLIRSETAAEVGLGYEEGRALRNARAGPKPDPRMIWMRANERAVSRRQEADQLWFGTVLALWG